MDPDECRSRFERARVTHLATMRADGHPHLVPVTTALVGPAVVFMIDQKPKTTTRLQRLANIAAQPAVAFLADEYREDWSALWWVRADAIAGIVEDGHQWAAALAALVAKYPQYRRDPPQGPAVVAIVERWTGWSAS